MPISHLPPTRQAGIVTAAYLLAAGLWVIISDHLFEQANASPWAATMKGLAFVAATGALLFTVVRRGLQRLSTAQAALRDRVTALQAAQQDLLASREQVREFAAQQEQAREAERARISRELHDGLGQLLSGLRLDLAWLRQHAASEAHEARTREAIDLADRTIDEVRRISNELRPGMLDDLGLAPAVRWLGREVARRTSLAITVDGPDDLPPIDDGVATAAFRIVQEALANVTRHAQARAVLVRLRAEHDQLLVDVEDDGRGFDRTPGTAEGHLGLTGMRERARTWAGTLQIDSTPFGGTRLALRLPLHGHGRRAG